MRLYVQNIQLLYMALLYAFGYKTIKLAPISPTFFANVAKILGIRIEYVDNNLDFSSSADVVHNFFETYTPKADIVFQNFGKNVGEAKVFVKKEASCIEAEFFDEEIFEKTKLFLDGGVVRGRLWNYDVVSLGIKDRVEPCWIEDLEEKIAKSNEVVEFFSQTFVSNPYFDILSVGDKTLKNHYPVLLKPSLYCPKEDIYQELRKRGVDVQVRFKPLYRLKMFEGATLRGSEELYKAVLSVPLRKDVVEPLFEVLSAYRYRGCSF